MATTIRRPTALATERLFFFYMAVALLVTAIAGFASDVVIRHVWFTDFPWPAHLHAVVFSSWIILYVVQNWLVADGRNVDLHRRLGWLGAGIAVLMVPIGIAGTLNAVARGSITGMFPLGLFLAMDILGVLGFAGLTFAAIRLRRHAAWHKRLMLCGTILVISPALGRLQALFPLGGFAPFAVIAGMLVYLFAGIAFDLVVMRRVHPAYWWGAATLLALQLLTGPIGFSAPVTGFATRLAG